MDLRSVYPRERPASTTFMKRNFLRIVSGILGLGSACVALAVPGPVAYNPQVKIIQGNQPLNVTYPLTITAPTPLLYTGPLTVTFSVVSKPASVSEADALDLVSASPATISFATANQQVVTNVTLDVPIGTLAGDYEYRIRLTGWPVGVLDTSVATINAKVLPPESTNNVVPTVTLNMPVSGATAAAPATFSIQFDASVPAGGRPIDGLTATFAGVPLDVTATGLGTLSASGTATSPTVLVPGIYTVRVSATNRAGTSFDSAEVEVTGGGTTPPPFCADIEWLPPISHSKTVSGGSTVPIKFALSCPSSGEKFIRDTSIVIVITELVESGPAPAAVLYLYGSGGPKPPTYSINGNHYQLNFQTAKGAHRYRIEVYRPLTPSGAQLIGTKELNTK
jgi:hypothetical protein